MKSTFYLLSVLLIFTFSTLAQQTVKFNAQFRPRFEIDNKDFNKSNDASSFTLLRTRIGVQFNPSVDLSGYIQLQDSRYMGGETTTTTDMKNVDIHQAYFKIDNLFSLPIDFKFGRMEMTYNNERVIGVSNWGNVGRSLDGVLLSIKSEAVKVELFGFKELEKLGFGDTLDQNIYGAAFDLALVNDFKIQPIFIWQKYVPSSQISRFTLGSYFKGSWGGFTHEEDVYYQFGKQKINKVDYDIKAFMFGINASYNFDLSSKPFIGAGLDYYSGDDNLTDTQYKVFNTVYGTGHKYLGYMDYFTNIPNDTYSLGIADFIFKGGLNLITDLKASVLFHILNANAGYKLKSGSTTKQFGNEIDFTVNYTYNKYVTFESGLSFFSPGDIYKEKKGGDSASWFYLLAVVTF